MVKCSECGYENMEGLDYCDGCGARLQSGAATEPESPATSPPAESEQPGPHPEPAQASQPAAAEPSLQKPTPVEQGSSAAAGQGAEAPSEPPAATEAPHAEAPAAPVAEKAPAPAEAPAALKVKLEIVRGGRKGHVFELEEGNNVIGRWDPETGAFPEVDLEQDDPEAKVSRKHALIRVDHGKVTIEDIGSLNGTYVNRQPRLQPGQPVELKNGDEIIVGKTFFKVSIEPVA